MGSFFKIKEIKIENRKVKKDIKISVLSDLHFSKQISKQKLNKIEEKIKEFHPNYICIVGDLLDSTNIIEEKHIQILEDFLKSIATIPTLIALGNHDTGKRVTKKENKKRWIYNFPDTFLKNLEKEIPNLYILNNKNFEDEEILISGFTPSYESYSKKREKERRNIFEKDLKRKNFLCEREKNIPTICLIHNPIYLTKMQNRQKLKHYDILLAGHMHNGVVPPLLDEIWKSNRGIVSPNKGCFIKNTRGIITFKKEKTKLIISGGIVKIGDTSPKIMKPLDFLFPMSIENITLTNQKERIKNYYKK